MRSVTRNWLAPSLSPPLARIWVKCCRPCLPAARARTKNAPGFADRGHLAWDRPRERRVAVHVHPLQLRQLARWLLPQMAGGMGTVAALPTPSSRITQCTPKGGLAKGHGSVLIMAAHTRHETALQTPL